MDKETVIKCVVCDFQGEMSLGWVDGIIHDVSVFSRDEITITRQQVKVCNFCGAWRIENTLKERGSLNNVSKRS